MSDSLFDRPLAAFDIETIPDAEGGRRVWDLDGDDAEVIAAMSRLRLEQTEGRSDFLAPPLHRVVSVGLARLDPESGAFELSSLGGEAADERSHLEGFFSFLAGSPVPPRLVSWNGSGFDLPVLRYRAMQHGIAAPELYRTDGDWRWNNYQNRFHDLHVDLMDALSGYGSSSRVGLDLLSKLHDLPGKSFLEGSVLDHVLGGGERAVHEYCKLDVVLTLLLFLRWAAHRGSIDDRRLRELVEAVRRGLRRERDPGWAAIEARLAGWPH